MNNLLSIRPATRNLVDADFDRFFNSVWDDSLWNLAAYSPAVDVKEEEGRYELEADLPGITEKDIQVTIDRNILTISSKTEEAKEEKKQGYLLKERKTRSFCRSFVLPDDVDKEKIEAEFKNGVLHLSLAKNPAALPRNIEVKLNS